MALVGSDEPPAYRWIIGPLPYRTGELAARSSLILPRSVLCPYEVVGQLVEVTANGWIARSQWV